MTLLQKLADGVWLLPHDPDSYKVQPSVGIVCDQEQTILIDAGNGAPHARLIQLALQEINAPPVKQIIYTHHHWDHVFGAYVFDVPVTAHEQCYILLAEEAAKPWSLDYVSAQEVSDSRFTAIRQANPDWENFRIVLPEVTFAEHLTISLQNLTLKLRHIGGYHAPESITVQVREAGVLFLGDCFYPGRDVPQVNWKMLSGILAHGDVDTFVSSHTEPLLRRQRLKFWGYRALAGYRSRRNA